MVKISKLIMLSTCLISFGMAAESSKGSIYERLVGMVEAEANSAYGRSNNSISMGLGLNSMILRKRELSWLQEPNMWATVSCDENIYDNGSGQALTLGDLKKKALGGDVDSMVALIQAYIKGLFGINLESIFVTAELNKLFMYCEKLEPEKIGPLRGAFEKANGITQQLTADHVLERVREYFVGKNKEVESLYPYCYLIQYVKATKVDDIACSEVDSSDLVGRNGLFDILNSENMGGQNMLLVACALGLTDLAVEENMSSGFDSNNDPKIQDGEITLKELKEKAFNFDFDSFVLLIGAYKNGYFGIPKNKNFSQEAANLLALFSLTGHKTFLKFHATTLTENWFGTLYAYPHAMAEKLALSYAASNGCLNAKQLRELPPFSDSKITKQQILKGKPKQEEGADGCVIQ